MDHLGLESPKSKAAHSMDEALQGLEFRGPARHRAPLLHAGRHRRRHRLQRRGIREIVERGLDCRPPPRCSSDEESVLGWKEYEMEVVRDHADNCIIVCSIENIDPMGVHTGDSITVAPALTLTDKDYQRMRAASIAVLREIGVETRGSNVLVRGETRRTARKWWSSRLNPRRLASPRPWQSKATGFPIAQGRRPPGRRLHPRRAYDILDITGATPASFEPPSTMWVTKIPRFAFEKYPGSDPYLTTSSEVGGRGHGHRPQPSPRACRRRSAASRPASPAWTRSTSRTPTTRRWAHASIIRALGIPTPDRLRVIAQAFRHA